MGTLMTGQALNDLVSHLFALGELLGIPPKALCAPERAEILDLQSTIEIPTGSKLADVLASRIAVAGAAGASDDRTALGEFLAKSSAAPDAAPHEILGQLLTAMTNLADGSLKIYILYGNRILLQTPPGPDPGAIHRLLKLSHPGDRRHWSSAWTRTRC